MAQPSSPYHLDLITRESKAGNGATAASASGGLDTSNGSSPGGSGGGGGMGGGKYPCPFCDFSTNRLNVLILHQKACT